MLFPQIEALTGKKGIMDANIEQHHLFEPRLMELNEYASTATVETFDATKIKLLIERFGDVLHNHLKAEIPTCLRYSDIQVMLS
jgi:hypothetical protein